MCIAQSLERGVRYDPMDPTKVLFVIVPVDEQSLGITAEEGDGGDGSGDGGDGSGDGGDGEGDGDGEEALPPLIEYYDGVFEIFSRLEKAVGDDEPGARATAQLLLQLVLDPREDSVGSLVCTSGALKADTDVRKKRTGVKDGTGETDDGGGQADERLTRERLRELAEGLRNKMVLAGEVLERQWQARLG